MSDEPLLSVAEFRALLGESPIPSPADAGYELAIEAATDMVRDYTGMTFELSDPLQVTPTARSFYYDGNGYLDVDECQAISSVRITPDYIGAQGWDLNVDQWSRYPLNKPVALWLQLPGGVRGGISPQMGFSYNLDTLWNKYPTKPVKVTVTALWGWDKIPPAVKQAIAWTATHVAKTGNPYHQESIENYSRTRVVAEVSDSIPVRAQAALDPYVFPRV